MDLKRKIRVLSVMLSAFLAFASATTVFASDGAKQGVSPADPDIKVMMPEAERKESGEAIKKTRSLSYAMDIIKRKDKLKKTSVRDSVVFDSADFAHYAGGDLVSVTIVSLPPLDEGVLKLGALDVFVGQSISAAALSKLKFVPAYSGAEASFEFSVNGSEDVNECVVSCLKSQNSAPVAQSASLYTKQNVTVYSTFDVADPDGDDVVCSVITQPKHGLLKADGVSFSYTPDVNFIGSDSFVCSFEDKYGNKSEPVTVKVKAERNKSGFVYSDMRGNKAEYAAYLLAEKEILKGEAVADSVNFEPDKPVSRVDFMVMAMKAAGYSPNLYSAVRDGFEGAEALSETQRGYAVTAMSANIIDKDALSKPSDAITEKEAAAVISALGGSCTANEGDKTLTRADAAVMIAALIDGRR